MTNGEKSQAARREKPEARRVEIELVANDTVNSKDIVRRSGVDYIDVRLRDKIEWKNSQKSSCTIKFKRGVCPFESKHNEECVLTIEPGGNLRQTVAHGRPGEEFEFLVAFEEAPPGGHRGTPRIIIQS
jgi:hypothetical protein